MNKLLTIAIPTYNRCSKLERQLLFLKSELDMDSINTIHFMVSDNCSNDETPLFLKEFAKDNNWFSFVSQTKNLGIVGNMNAILDNTTTEFIWFVSDDDILEKGIINRVLEILKKHEDLHYIFLNYDVFFGDESNQIEKGIFSDNGGYIKNGKEKAISLFLDPLREVPLMFITACVYKVKNLRLYREQYENKDGLEVPLLFSFASCSQGAIFLEQEIFIHQRGGNISWSKEASHLMFNGIFTVLSKLHLFGYHKHEIYRLNRCWIKRVWRVVIKNLCLHFKETSFLLKYFDLKIILYLIKASNLWLFKKIYLLISK